MNHGNLATSKRLQATLKALLDRGGSATSLQLHGDTGSLNVHSDIAALRENGYCIPRAEFIGTSEKGTKVYMYKILNYSNQMDLFKKGVGA